MGNFPILTAVTFLPLAGALLIMLVQTATGKSGDDAERGRQSLMAGLIFSAATFLASLVMLVSFEVDAPGYQLVEEVSWFAGVQYKLGIDGMSLLLILLTTLLTPISLIASFGSVKERVTEYTIAFLVLETFMIGVFCALDMVLFYVFFEAGLIPMFIIIGVWGGAERIYASFKFFLYTLLGSLFMLAAIVFMYMQAGTSDITQLANYAFAPEVVGKTLQATCKFYNMTKEYTKELMAIMIDEMVYSAPRIKEPIPGGRVDPEDVFSPTGVAPRPEVTAKLTRRSRSAAAPGARARGRVLVLMPRYRYDDSGAHSTGRVGSMSLVVNQRAAKVVLRYQGGC